MFTVGLTVFYHYLPMSVFRRFSFIYAWSFLEYHGQSMSLWIINRNQLENIYSHNAWYFFIMLYLRSNSMLTAALFEGLAYGEMALYQTASAVYNGAFMYFVTVPATYLLQIFVLGADLQVHVPGTLDGLL